MFYYCCYHSGALANRPETFDLHVLRYRSETAIRLVRTRAFRAKLATIFSKNLA